MLATALMALPPAGAQTVSPAPIAYRAGNHHGFGRLVLDLPEGVGASIAERGETLDIRFSVPVKLAAGQELPRYFRALEPNGQNAVTVRLAPGAVASSVRLPGRLVIDSRPAAPPPRAPRARIPVETLLPELAREPPPPAEPAAPAAIAPPPAREADLKAESTAAPAPAVHAIVFPAGPDVGAAAFLRGGRLLVVFDRPRPQGEKVPGATIRNLPDGAVAELDVSDWRAPGLGIAQNPEGWCITPGAPPSGAAPASAAIERGQGAVRVRTAQAARVVAVPDPVTGATLLVGTARTPQVSVPVGWRSAEFTILPSLLGLAVEPFSDRVQVSADRHGFRISAGTAPLALEGGPAPFAAAARKAGLTQLVAFPTVAAAELRSRLERERREAARSPALSRLRPRLLLARTMLALGLDRDALGVLAAAEAADPRSAGEPELLLLRGAAQILAGDAEAAVGLLDPRLPATDDVAFWRAMRDVERGQPGADAISSLARTAAILLDFPKALRARLLPAAAEALIAADKPDSADLLLGSAANDPALALARAMRAEAAGQTGDALARYDALAAGRDRLMRFRAAMHAIEVRLHNGAFTQAQAADAMDRLEPAWRGDRYELARRTRAAELRAQSGDLSAALAALREAAALFPQAAPGLQQRGRTLLADVLRPGSGPRISASALASVLKDEPGLLDPEPAAPDGGTSLAQRAAETLADPGALPREAVPVLERLSAALPDGPARAGIGLKLAEMRLADNDPAAAQSALAGTEAEGLPPPLAARRAVLAERARAAKGEVEAALAALAGIDREEALAARADIAEQAGKFGEAAAAVRLLAARTLAPGAPLDPPARQLVLRLAADAARAGDETLLADLRASIGPALPPGADGDVIRLLLAPPVRSLADLPRAAQETSLAGALAQAIRAGGAGGTP